MEARLVREELVKCQRAEGVNHYKECQHLAEMYTGMIRENKVSHEGPEHFVESVAWTTGLVKLPMRRPACADLVRLL